MRTLPITDDSKGKAQDMLARAPLATLLLLACGSTAAAAQASADDGPGRWGLRVRAVLSGSSDHSEPTGYTLYSGIALEAGVVRWLGDAAALELAVRTESREVEGPEGNLGSLEMLPLSLAVAWRPRGPGGGDLQPYLGAGLNLTATWEKSGALDSTNPPPRLAPLVQVGADWALASGTALNVDARWHTMDVDVEDLGATAPSVRLDPLALGLGLTVRF